MEQTRYTTFKNIREHLGLSQQDIADIAGVDVALVEKYERGELLPAHGEQVTHDQIVLPDKITGALFKVVAKRYPQKVKAAVDPVLELAKTYSEGSVMRNFLNSAGKFLKL
jgi:transcriptional regulator with XRE-family HTH domain